MSNVMLSISGHSFTVACAEGEEDHVRMLGQLIDAKLRDLPHSAGQSDARSLLFASLLLADEVHELRQAGTAKAPASTSAPASAPATMPDLAPGLEMIAQRLENLATHLEGRSRTH